MIVLAVGAFLLLCFGGLLHPATWRQPPRGNVETELDRIQRERWELKCQRIRKQVWRLK